MLPECRNRITGLIGQTRKRIKHITIVGGGTAGWMAAIAIGARFPEKQITVVDATAIGPIGVGESVTGVVLEFVGDPLYDLTKGELFRRCEATFKLGVWYKDWCGVGTEYLSPIDAPQTYFKHSYDTFIEEFFALAAADGMRLGEIQLYSELMRHNRTDLFRNRDGSVNESMAFASCHFDALKFGDWLREVAVQRANITHVDDVVERFEQDANSGHVTQLITKSGRMIGGDLFIDCSGFHRTLLAKAYDPQWISYADHIRVDSAIPPFSPMQTRSRCRTIRWPPR